MLPANYKKALVKFCLVLLLNLFATANGFKQVDFSHSLGLSAYGNIKKIPPYLLNTNPIFTSDIKVNERGLIFKQLFDVVFTRQLEPVAETRIPKIMHHIWLDGKLPATFKFCLESCQRQHPDWQHRLWTDADLEKHDWRFKDILLSKEINPGKKSDILRLEILYKYGGVYLDTDFFCCKSLTELHKTVDFYGCIVDDWFSVANGVIGCIAGHKLIGQCLDTIKPNYDNSPMGILLNTGPYFFTEQIVSFITKHPTANLVILPPSYFFALPSSHSFDFWRGTKNLFSARKFEQPESLAIHLWATSWLKHSWSTRNPLYELLKKHNLCFTSATEPEALIYARRPTDGATPLIAATRHNLLLVVDLLGRNGANFKARDFYNHDALDYAQKNRSPEMINLINAYTN